MTSIRAFQLPGEQRKCSVGMKMVYFICLALVVWTTSCSTNHLEGTWNCLSANVNGKPLPDATVKLLRLMLSKDRYKTEKGSEVLFDSTYSLDSSKTPKQINMVGTEGDLKGKVAQGIYALDGDMLKICYTMPGSPRPTQFESAAGSQAYLIIWKRNQAK